MSGDVLGLWRSGGLGGCRSQPRFFSHNRARGHEHEARHARGKSRGMCNGQQGSFIIFLLRVCITSLRYTVPSHHLAQRLVYLVVDTRLYPWAWDVDVDQTVGIWRDGRSARGIHYDLCALRPGRRVVVHREPACRTQQNRRCRRAKLHDSGNHFQYSDMAYMAVIVTCLWLEDYVPV